MIGGAMQPSTSYLICCNPRSGSWLLAEALHFMGIAGYPREYFMQEEEKEWFDRWGVSTYAAYLDKVIEAGTTPNGVFGAKAHWYQFVDLPPKLRQLPGCGKLALPEMMSKLFPNLRYIWITRRDKVRQAVSHLKAIQTRRWWQIEGWKEAEDEPLWRKQSFAQGKEPMFDFKEIDRLLQMAIANDRAWQQYFQECGAKPLVVVYEELIQAYESTIRWVLEELHIPLPADLVIPEPRLKKQADPVSEEWVQRYQRIKQAEVGTSPGGMTRYV